MLLQKRQEDYHYHRFFKIYELTLWIIAVILVINLENPSFIDFSLSRDNFFFLPSFKIFKISFAHNRLFYKILLSFRTLSTDYFM